MRVLIIGGSDAGISAALRIQELDKSVETTVLLADEFPNWSICGLPYYLSGETPDWRSLAHRTEFAGIEVLRRQRAERIDPNGRTVMVGGPNGASLQLTYDRLIVATGATPTRPEIPGIDLANVHLLHTMGDAQAVHRLLECNPPAASAVIVGAGYIGLEMAEALAHRGVAVTVLSRSDPVFPSIDPVFGRAIEEELRRNGVQVLTRASLSGIKSAPGGNGLIARIEGGSTVPADLVLVAVGVQPASDLAEQAGATLGIKGAIQVDRAMRTGVADMLAAGDCVETWHRVLGRPVYLPLGTTSHKQGRIAGETALGGERLFAGSVGTQVVKLFDLAVARTGLLETEANDAGFQAETSEIETWDHKAYYPGAERLRLRVTGDRVTGLLLGAQILGPWRAEISKRIDIFATALFHGMRIEELSDLDLSYAPPFSSPWDPVQIASQAWVGRSGWPRP